MFFLGHPEKRASDSFYISQSLAEASETLSFHVFTGVDEVLRCSYCWMLSHSTYEIIKVYCVCVLIENRIPSSRSDIDIFTLIFLDQTHANQWAKKTQKMVN
ncbi:hypothetical protein RND81_12G133500 [Saponaria officinalis]|uniref:Uncharacterized protein n=1 Tax=Saponaria officinalis TaxID=3572 RepID=A0AAW1HA20_SAPOF